MEPFPVDKSIGDHVHTTARAIVSIVPMLGGPALEFLDSVVAPPIQSRQTKWLNDLAERVFALQRENRLTIDGLKSNEEFISATMQATQAALRNHEQEKLDALRNAVLNVALGQAPANLTTVMFMTFVDEFTVWHLRVLKALSDNSIRPRGHLQAIAQQAMASVPELQNQFQLAEFVVEELCRRGLLFWNGGGTAVSFTSHNSTQVTQLGQDFLAYVSDPQTAVHP